jgi:hypothetical protein
MSRRATRVKFRRNGRNGDADSAQRGPFNAHIIARTRETASKSVSAGPRGLTRGPSSDSTDRAASQVTVNHRTPQRNSSCNRYERCDSVLGRPVFALNHSRVDAWSSAGRIGCGLVGRWLHSVAESDAGRGLKTKRLASYPRAAGRIGALRSSALPVGFERRANLAATEACGPVENISARLPPLAFDR